jgi:hypothetical protein
MLLKIDYDNKIFGKWLDRFSFVYSFWFPSYRVQDCDVYETTHGFHIEIYMEWKRRNDLVMSDISKRNVVNLMECLLYSDLNKQLVSFNEGTDILFKRKSGVVRTKRQDLQVLLLLKVKELESNPKFLHQYKVKNP